MSNYYKEYFLKKYSINIDALNDKELTLLLQNIICRNNKVIALQIAKNELLKCNIN